MKALPLVGAIVRFDPQERNHDCTLGLMMPMGVEGPGVAVQFCADTYICLFSQAVVGTDRLPFHVLGNTCTVLAHYCSVSVAECGSALGDRNLWGPVSTLLDIHTATGM